MDLCHCEVSGNGRETSFDRGSSCISSCSRTAGSWRVCKSRQVRKKALKSILPGMGAGSKESSGTIRWQKRARGTWEWQDPQTSLEGIGEINVRGFGRKADGAAPPTAIAGDQTELRGRCFWLLLFFRSRGAFAPRWRRCGRAVPAERSSPSARGLHPEGPLLEAPGAEPSAWPASCLLGRRVVHFSHDLQHAAIIPRSAYVLKVNGEETLIFKNQFESFPVSPAASAGHGGQSHQPRSLTRMKSGISVFVSAAAPRALGTLWSLTPDFFNTRPFNTKPRTATNPRLFVCGITGCCVALAGGGHPY